MSVPSGKAAPVKILMALFGRTKPLYELPARERPSTSEKQCWPVDSSPLNAYPSTAEFVNGGLDLGAISEPARIRPSLKTTGILSVPTIVRNLFSRRFRASSTGVQVMPGGKAKQSLDNLGVFIISTLLNFQV